MKRYESDNPSYWDDELDRQLETVKELLKSIALDNSAFNETEIDVSEIIEALKTQRDKFRMLTNRLATISAESVELVVDLEEKNKRLAIVTVKSAELMADLEENNKTLHQVNKELAHANAHAAELMAEIELKDKDIRKLNKALAQANATASEFVAELELRKEELDEYEDNLRDFFNSTTDLIQQVGPNGNFLHVNKAWCNALGYTKEETLNLNVKDIIRPDKVPLIKEIFSRIIQGETVHNMETVFMTKEGKEIMVQGNTNGRFKDGHFIMSRGIFRDITESKQAEEKLRRSEKRLKILFESAPDAIYLSDFEGNLIDGNKAAENLVGYKRNELVGKNFLDFGLLPSDYVKKAVEGLAKNIIGEPMGPKEFVLNCKNRKQVPVEIRTFPVNIDGQDISLGIIRDITERKKAEKALRENEERYRSLFDNMFNGFAYHVIVLDDNDKPIDYVFLEVNDAFERLTGLNKKEIIGKQVTEVLPGIENDPADWIGRYARVALEGENIHFEQYSEQLNKWYSVSSYCPKKGYFATVFEDITERKKAEMAIRLSEEKLRKVLESSPDAITVTDLEGKLIQCNQATLDLYGFSSKDELIGKNSLEFISDNDYEKAMENLKKTLKLGFVKNTEYTLKTKEGKAFPAELSASVIMDSTGNPTSLISIIKDISYRKTVDKALKEKTTKLERFAKLSIGREKKMIEIKKRLNELEATISR